jgi:EpsI family protein
MDRPPPRLTPFAFAWAVVALGGLAVGWCLWQFWGLDSESSDRWLIVLATGWLVYRMRDDLRSTPVRPTRWGLVPLAVAVALFSLGWFLAVQVALRPLLLWWLTGAWLLAVAGLVLVQSGMGWLRRLAFPLLFFLLALPTPNRILLPIQGVLQEATTSAAAAVLPRIGFPAERNGFVLHMASGALGVEEACSGVKSLTALTAIAALVAYLRGFGLLRGAALIGLALPVVAVCNAARVVLSGVLQETVGRWAVRGVYHEILGFTMIFVGLGLVLALSWLIRPRRPRPAPAPAAPAAKPVPARGGVAAAVLLGGGAAGALLAAWLGAAEVRAEGEFANLEALPLRLTEAGRVEWEGRDEEVPAEVAAKLTPDRILHRLYQNPLGQEAHVWVVFWSANSAVRGYHHPDVCFPNQGWTRTGQEQWPVELAGPGEVLPITVRRFERADHGHVRRQLICYWTQEGPYVWAEGDEAAAYAAGPSHVWVRDRLLRRGELARSGRIAVTVGAELWGGTYAEKAVDSFCRRFAAELYKACPWATPRRDARRPW